MPRVQNVHASPRYSRAIAAISDLLAKLRLEFIFVGTVARAAWLGSAVEDGALDVVVLMTPEQKNQVAMMANNRGFRVDRDEVEATAELDLVPLNFSDGEGGEVRVHVLVASNALYGRMVAAGMTVSAGDRQIRVATAEDIALLLALSDDEESLLTVGALFRLPDFDRAAYNSRLVSIGLSELVVTE